MVRECRDGNNTRYETGKLVFLSDIKKYPLRIDGIRNEQRKIRLNANNMNKQKLCDTLQK